LPSVFFIFANILAIRPSRQCGYAPSKAAKPRVGCAAFRGRAPAHALIREYMHDDEQKQAIRCFLHKSLGLTLGLFHAAKKW
jgi:hypothetical protein